MQFDVREARGITLLELIITITIISIIIGIAMVALAASREASQLAVAQSDLRQLEIAMQYLYFDSGRYPHGGSNVCPPANPPVTGNEINLRFNSAGLMATDGSHPGWVGPYISEAEDPWGNPYFFDGDYYCTPDVLGCEGHVSSGNADRSVIMSCGPDGVLGDADAGGPIPDNGTACAFNEDNIVLNLCR